MKRGWTKKSMAEQYPTEEARAKHRAWLVMCCQARFRGEPCDLTEAEFFAIWEPYWAQRGRGRDQMTMTRCDSELPWTRDNVEIITRRDHLVREKNFWKGR